MEYEKYLLEVTELLLQHSERQRIEEAAKDKSSRLKFMAIRVPLLRKLSKTKFSFASLPDEEIIKVLDYIWSQSHYYEVMAISLNYCLNNLDIIRLENLKYFLNWSSKIENWGHCDSLSYIYSILCEKHRSTLLTKLKVFNATDNIWMIRLSIVSLVHYCGKNAAYLSPNEVFPMLYPHTANKNKYVGASIGWVLREMHLKYPQEVSIFISENKLTTACKSKLRNILHRKE